MPVKDIRLPWEPSSRTPPSVAVSSAPAIKDIGKVFLVAIVLDTTYQLWVLKSFHIGQLLIVAVVCAIVPYVLVRGPITRLARRLHHNKETSAKASIVNPPMDSQRRH